MRGLNRDPVIYHSEWHVPGFHMPVEDIISQEQSLQPSSRLAHTDVSSCGLVSNLLPKNPSNWKMIPCNQSISATYICEFSVNTIHSNLNIRGYFNFSQQLLSKCDRGWMRLNGSCYFLLQSNRKHYLNGCTILNASAVSAFTYNDVILNLYYYTYSLQRSTCLCTNINEAKVNPVLIQNLFATDTGIFDHNLQATLYNLNIYGGYNNLLACSNNVWIYCEKEPVLDRHISSTYQNAYLYQCLSGEFILESFKCDFHPDCYTGEDEDECILPCFKTNLTEDCYGCHSDSCLCRSTYFKCRGGGGCVGFEKLCNNIGDCQDNSDALVCVVKECIANEFLCRNGECIPGYAECDGTGHCIDSEDEANCHKKEPCTSFECLDGTCLPQYKVNNFMPDCTAGEDESEYIWLAGSTYYYMNATCPNGTLPCYIGHSRCFSIENACVYDTEPDLSLAHCGNGAHLKLCRFMGCPIFTYKCPSSYCIPHWMICNGVIDCPEGEDEAFCPLTRCPPSYYKCKGDTQCLHLENFCDGKTHCSLHGDDEKACQGLMPPCPFRCSCGLHTFRCLGEGSIQMVEKINNQSRFTSWKRNLQQVTISYGNLTLLNGSFSNLPLLKYLDTSFNRLVALEANVLYYSVLLVSLDVSFNQIRFVSSKAVSHLRNLKFFNISHNRLQKLSLALFLHHSLVFSVDASFNEITDSDYVFQNKLLRINKLNIYSNNITILEDFGKANIFIDSLITDQQFLCCMLKSIPVCGVNMFHSSDICNRLLPNNLSRLFYWVSGALTCVVCATCHLLFTFRTMFGNRKESSLWNSTNFIQQNILFANVLHGLYLVFIAIADRSFQYIFPVKKQEWLDHSYCLALRVTSLLNPFQSAFLLFLQAAHFLKGVRANFDGNPVNYKINIIVLFSWCTILPISLTTCYWIGKRRLYVNINHGICSGFQGVFFPMFALTSITNNTFVIFLIAMQMSSTFCYICIAITMEQSKRQSQRKWYTKNEKLFFSRTLMTVGFWFILSLTYLALVFIVIDSFKVTMYHDMFVSFYGLGNAIALSLQYLHAH